MVTNSVVNCHLVVRDQHGNQVLFNACRLHQILGKLTNDSSVINRAGTLILVQLKPYKLMKLYDVKCVIYRTLKRLNYRRLAREYFRKKLA